LRAKRHLLLIFFATLLGLVAALVWMGLQLLRQDRALAGQRIREQCEAAADLAVASLQEQLSRTEEQLTALSAASSADLAVAAPAFAGRLAADSVLLVLRAGGMDAYPEHRLLFVPDGAPPPPAVGTLFAGADALEFRRQAFREAIAALGALARHPEPAVRAEAQLRATDRLQRLVEALLDFGRMEAGRRPYRFERLDAGALAHDVTEEFRREAAGHGFAVECSLNGDPCPVNADSEALSRALWNLLDNAAKYSGESRRIDVGVERAGGVVRLLVRDYGLGVPAGERQRIFDKFVRGEAARALGIKGTGIGLAMVKHIVAAHGGRVEVAAGCGKGSVFTIALPVRE